MSNTPRTDAASFVPRGIYIGRIVEYDFSCKLETELAEEKEAYQQMEMMANKLHGEIVAVTAERDALKSARDRAQEDWTETARLYRAVKIERDALLRGEGQKGDF